MNYFLPRKTLDAIADDADAPRISDLKFTPGVGIMDRVVEQLTRLLLPAFDSPNQVSRLFAEYISLALGSHIAQTYGGMRSVPAPARRSRRLARTARERAHKRKSSEEISLLRIRERMLALGRAFRPRVSAFDGSIATPVAAPATD